MSKGLTNFNHPLKVASVSDVHLGHRTTRADFIVNNLLRAFPNNEATGELDVIFIAGDLFDTLLTLPSEAVAETLPWMSQFLKTCRDRNIIVRALEGTPSHDWKQTKIMTLVNNGFDPITGDRTEAIGADFEYIDTLCIRQLGPFGMTVLYIPDEWDEPDRTWTQVQQLLLEHGLEKVDFTVMHGAFNYQLPTHVNVPTHVPERYLGITRHYVFIGHIHQFSTYEHIIAQGSFDRLCHGDEAPKGHVRATIYPNGTKSAVFVENVGAKRYDTVDCRGLELEVALTKIDQHVNDLPAESHVRVHTDKTSVLSAGMGTLVGKYPHLYWTAKHEKESTMSVERLLDARATFKAVELNKGNLLGITLERLEKKGVSSAVLARCRALMEELL